MGIDPVMDLRTSLELLFYMPDCSSNFSFVVSLRRGRYKNTLFPHFAMIFYLLVFFMSIEYIME